MFSCSYFHDQIESASEDRMVGLFLLGRIEWTRDRDELKHALLVLSMCLHLGLLERIVITQATRAQQHRFSDASVHVAFRV